MTITEKLTKMGATDYKALLAVYFWIGTAIAAGIAFGYAVFSGKESIAENILWAWLAALCALSGINTLQYIGKRTTEWTPDVRAGGASPAGPTVAKADTVNVQAAPATVLVPVPLPATNTLHDPGA